MRRRIMTINATPAPSSPLIVAKVRNSDVFSLPVEGNSRSLGTSVVVVAETSVVVVAGTSVVVVTGFSVHWAYSVKSVV